MAVATTCSAAAALPRRATLRGNAFCINTGGGTYAVSNPLHVASGAYGLFQQEASSDTNRFTDCLNSVVFDGNGGQLERSRSARMPTPTAR